ncbi:Gfo/Idh/MocA family protein [Salinigranum halophilum]|jgi:predicted dehydrogenase|uniref:Gfo/Idh/MocA family protein n=1 Tax=Salinigranum halophilum TaxID=2565931 RepID=UPI00115D61EF|nr:Gfo/Idh/MocA family oxidoreductase [Salinigranum halophilum]
MSGIDTVDVGVIGVGTMGINHARIYDEFNSTRLVGVADTDAARASEVADRYDTRPMSQSALVDAVDAVSVVVPTRHHARIARETIQAGVHTLVEKPFVRDPEVGRELMALADERDVVLQVGHIERFNPAVSAVMDITEEMDLVSVSANRLGPPVDRDGNDGVVMDLMIHDIDILLTLVDAAVESVSATGTDDGRYGTAQFAFENGVVGTLTASRVNQKRARTLDVADPEQLVEVDYFDQSVRIHRQADPSYEPTNGGVTYRNERVTEHPFVDTREPLKCELEAFVTAVNNGTEPRVTPREALRAVEMAHTIRDQIGDGQP